MSSPARVRYRERQRLRAADLRAEQEYLLGLAGRHNVGPHEWGLVRGLAFSFAGNELTVQPGLAVDGYGREIVVLEPVALGAVTVGQYVYLFVCESPHGGCGDKPNTHWRAAARVITSAELLPHPDIEPDLALASAAGLSCDTEPWPVLLGRVAQGAKGLVTDLSLVRSTRVKAAQIVAASGTSVVKIGKQGLGDRYHFRIAAKSGGALADRVAIDQDSNVNFWGDLILTGSKLAPIVLNVDGDILIITPSPSAGSQIRWRSYIEEKTKNSLILEFRDQLGQRDLLRLTIKTDRIPDQVKDFNQKAKLVSVKLEIRKPIDLTSPPLTSPPTALLLFSLIAIPLLRTDERSSAPSEAPSETPPPVNSVENHDTDFRYESPRIVFEPEITNRRTTFCGCDDDDETLPVLPNGIYFRAGSEPPKVPTRDVYAIKVGEGEQQHEELRAAVGNFEQGDFGRRFSIGMMTTEPNQQLKFVPWMQMLGNGAVDLPGGQANEQGKLFDMLVIKGTLKLPPLKPDPRDPLFKSLLLLSFLAGVLSKGGSPVTVAIESVPDFIESGSPFIYLIKVTNRDVLQTLKDIKIRDRFIGQPTPFEHDLQPKQIGPQGNNIYTITHPAEHIPDVTELSIEITVEATAGDLKVAGKVTTPKPIPVVRSPELDLSVFSGEVPAGWSAPITITNKANRALRIVGDLIVKDLGIVPPLTPISPLLSPSESTDTSALQIPADATGEKTFEVEMTYHWLAPTTADRKITATRTITVTKLLNASVVAAPTPDTPWTFDLNLTNPTGKSVKLLGLQVTVTSITSPAEQKVFDFPLDETIGKNKTFKQAGIAGIQGPKGMSVRVDVRMNLKVQKATWDGVVDTLPPIVIP